MRADAFRAWLAENYAASSADTHFYSVKKVEGSYGDLDQFYDSSELEALAVQFDYS